ncbi:hypothetical protein TruAng_003415 [Truncatella angustata]|nr:hypothetical protein TruAng_003415 [Truncatella angustata]
MDAVLSAPDHLCTGPVGVLTNNNGLKRKAEDEVRICVQCQEPYYEGDNDKHPCKYHDGELVQDYDSSVWDDWDECHGEQDCEENREECPDGFLWSCCDKSGTHPGCTRGPHRAVGATRGRYPAKGLYETCNSSDQWSDSGDDDEEDEDGEE